MHLAEQVLASYFHRSAFAEYLVVATYLCRRMLENSVPEAQNHL